MLTRSGAALDRLGSRPARARRGEMVFDRTPRRFTTGQACTKRIMVVGSDGALLLGRLAEFPRLRPPTRSEQVALQRMPD